MAVLLTEAAIRKGVKECRTCKKTKPISEFITSLKVKWMPNDCLECERFRRKKLYKMQRNAVVTKRNIKNGIDRGNKPEACEGCGSTDKLCLDHCHITGLPRGWICHKCNTILGFANDDDERLRKLAKYLEVFYNSEAVLNLLKAKEEEESIIYLPI